jgi:hypothetical protein
MSTKGLDMQTKRMVWLALSIGGIVVQNAACAEDRGTFAQQMACTPDVWRLCFDQIPDVNRITACLRQNTPQLSGSCRAVFESNASVQQPPAPGGRAMPQPRPDNGE